MEITPEAGKVISDYFGNVRQVMNLVRSGKNIDEKHELVLYSNSLMTHLPLNQAPYSSIFMQQHLEKVRDVCMRLTQGIYGDDQRHLDSKSLDLVLQYGEDRLKAFLRSKSIDEISPLPEKRSLEEELRFFDSRGSDDPHRPLPPREEW